MTDVSYYAPLDRVVVQGDVRSYLMTWTDTSGTPVDVSSWDVYFKAESTHTTDTITVAPAAVTKSDSGSGVTDTFEIPFSATDLDVDPGFYKQEIAIKRGTSIDTAFKGTLTVVERLTEVS